MNIENYNKKDLFLTALKSENDSKIVYHSLAQTVKNFMLKDKLEFLAAEEQKHYDFFKQRWDEAFPGVELVLPDENLVPLPEIELDLEDIRFSEIFQQAMDAEKAASEFYKSLAQRFENQTKMHNTLMYFADMEIEHFKILENEKESMERYEESDVYWPMTHVGP